MSTLTLSQRTTLRTAIQADGTANGYLLAGDTISLRAWLNAASATVAWIVAQPPGATDEACNWVAFDTLSAGKRDSWGFFVALTRNFSKNKVRKWITDVWGAATGGSDAAAILLAATEFATAAQNILGGTVRVTDSVSALDRTYIAQVDQEDVNRIIAGT